jgi:hypothetical protein
MVGSESLSRWAGRRRLTIEEAAASRRWDGRAGRAVADAAEVEADAEAAGDLYTATHATPLST